MEQGNLAKHLTTGVAPGTQEFTTGKNHCFK